MCVPGSRSDLDGPLERPGGQVWGGLRIVIWGGNHVLESVVVGGRWSPVWGGGTCVPGSLRSLDAPLERRGKGLGACRGCRPKRLRRPGYLLSSPSGCSEGERVEIGREVVGRVGIGVFGTPEWERVWPGRFRSAVGGRGGGRGRARPERFVAGRLLVVLAGVGVAGGCREGAGVCRREGEGVMWWSEA